MHCMCAGNVVFLLVASEVVIQQISYAGTSTTVLTYSDPSMEDKYSKADHATQTRC